MIKALWEMRAEGWRSREEKRKMAGREVGEESRKVSFLQLL